MVSSRPKATKVIRGHRKLELLHLLADGEITQSEMARRFEVTPAAIKHFKTRNQELIDQIQANRDDEFAGLWIAKKVNRVAAYQEDVEYVDDALDELPPEDANPLIASKHRALKSVAEELGQLVVKQDTNAQVNYKFDVENLGDLK